MEQRDRKLFNISLKVSVVATALWSGILAVLLSDIINYYTLEGTEEGLMGSMVSTGALIALLTTIFLQGRLKKPQIIIWGGFLASAILIVQGISMPFMLFLLACFTMGFGHGAVDSSQSAFLADLNKGDTARHMGALHGIFGIGGMLTPILLHRLLQHFEWRTIYIIAGLICFVLVAQFAMVTRYMGPRVSVAGRREPKLTLSGLREFFGRTDSVYVLLSIFFGAAAQSGIIIWTIRYVSVFLVSPEIAAICLSIFWITTTISRFGSPMLPMQPSLIVALGAFIAAVAWTIAVLLNHPLGMCVASGIAGLVSGSCIPMMLSEGAAINPEKTGFSTSILMICKTIGQIISPIVVAFVMSLGSMRTGMYVTSILFVLNGIFAALMIRKPAIPRQ